MQKRPFFDEFSVKMADFYEMSSKFERGTGLKSLQNLEEV